jgi:predicted MFS family arabinose efflux permease
MTTYRNQLAEILAVKGLDDDLNLNQGIIALTLIVVAVVALVVSKRRRVRAAGERGRKVEGRMKRVSVRTSLGMAFAIMLGNLIFTIGVALFRTDSGKGNQIPAAIACCIVGVAIVAGTTIKGVMVLRSEK